MHVQGENKIYIYNTDEWYLEGGGGVGSGAGAGGFHPITRLHEPGIVYSKVRFLNNDSWLASYGEEGRGSSAARGVRIWDTSTWSLIHLINDGAPGLFPFCC